MSEDKEPYQVEARVNRVLVEVARLKIMYGFVPPVQWVSQIEELFRAFDKLPEGMVQVP